jgi:hypothetical protein
MSVLTYVVIANPSDASEVGKDFLSKKFDWHDFPGVCPDVLDALSGVLSGTPVSKSRNCRRTFFLCFFSAQTKDLGFLRFRTS